MAGNGLALLDRALDVARNELRALADRDYDTAADLSQERAALLDEAWKGRTPGVQDDAYRTKLLELAEIQKGLMRIAEEAQELVRAGLRHTHREQKRMTAYHRSVSMALN